MVAFHHQRVIFVPVMAAYVEDGAWYDKLRALVPTPLLNEFHDCWLNAWLQPMTAFVRDAEGAGLGSIEGPEEW